MYRQAYIEITNACNFSCHFCPSPQLERARGFMAPAMFRQIVREAKPLVEQVYLHVLGEPLLHPRFAEFLEILVQESMTFSITTNGSLLDRHADALLYNPMLRQINFSLHALREPTLPCDGERVLESVLSYCRKALDERPNLHVNLRFWNLDAPEAEADPWSVQVRDQIVQAFGTEWVPPIPGRKHRRFIGRISIHQDTRFVWPAEAARKEVHAPRTRGFCQALHTHFAVLVDGTVVPCCLDAEGQIPLGRIQANSLAQILEAPRAQRMRSGFGEGKLVEAMCQTCDFCHRFKKHKPS